MVKSKSKAMTPSEAIAAFERAYRSGSPAEVENLLREMLNVQVAVVEDVASAKKELAAGKRLKTVPVPLGVFLNKVKEILKSVENNIKRPKVYYLEPSSLVGKNDSHELLREVRSSDQIVPGKTYVVLKDIAGYSPENGLTFQGDGLVTGFEEQRDAERREKFTEGRFQTWQEHSKGVWQRSQRIAEIYRPFIQSWAERVLAEQFQQESDPANEINEFVDSVLWAMQVAVLFHDIGKLDKDWQEKVWENEEKIRKQKIDWRQNGQFIARTSPLSDTEMRKQLRKPPPHAPFAYPFLKTLLRRLLGDYRFLDAIALSAARHHCLEVAGAVEKGSFQLTVGAEATLQSLLSEVLGKLSEDEHNALCKFLFEALEAIRSGSEADEPPSPSDDFYFIYCLANRMVKVCDWEDAGEKTIELPGWEE